MNINTCMSRLCQFSEGGGESEGEGEGEGKAEAETKAKTEAEGSRVQWSSALVECIGRLQW